VSGDAHLSCGSTAPVWHVSPHAEVIARHVEKGGPVSRGHGGFLHDRSSFLPLGSPERTHATT
jgi:hypothetical protein